MRTNPARKFSFSASFPWSRRRPILVSASLSFLLLLFASAAFSQTQTIAKSLGSIKAISGNTLTLSPESGPEITANVQANARVLRLNPGDKDTKNATPIQLTDLQVGDTVRVRGYASADGKSIATLEVILISKSAVAAVGDQIRQDWQKRGIGGVVSAVDTSAGTVTISVTGFTGKKSITIHTSKNTIVRRYAPDSIKFEDAKPSALANIQPGDQLRARGDRNPDGTEVTADEIVAGRFRNVAGTVNSVDASAGLITVQDVLSKAPVQVKITSDSQLHQLPAEMAQRIAVRIKAAIAGSMPPGTPGANAAQSQSAPNGVASGTPSAAAAAGAGTAPAQGSAGSGPAGAGSGRGTPDFQSMLSHMPAVALADLHKGDAVMLVTTEGSASSASTAITLLSGVDPILRAAPSAGDMMMLSPWSLGGGAGGGDAGSQ
jgi:hypothetical protein